MKLRNLMIITFCLITLLPMTLFWMWPYSEALDSEVKDVQQRHLVIAKNLSETFERYYKDVVSIFSIIDTNSEEQIDSQKLKKVLKSYHFSLISLVNQKGVVKNCLFNNQLTCPKTIDTNILELAKDTLKKDEIHLSTVTEDTSLNTGPILLLVKEEKEHILLAYLSTQYIVQMGKRVAFGQKGHAAVVDQEGNVLAHPLDSWIMQRKNIIKVSAVQKMLAGKTGVERFYSPALKGDMIAGYTHVANVNWGVMVPQPIIELENKAKRINNMALFVMFFGVLLALLISIPISFVLLKPLENLSTAIKRVEEGDSNVDFQWNLSKIIPLEIRDLNNSFSNMMTKIEKNKKEITQLAYFDSTSKLPNRNYFYQLSNKVLDIMQEKNQKAALIFIDFDEFKTVNDTYGHKTGDELLALFGKSISEYFYLDCTYPNKVYHYETLPKVIPARLAGDEFVILFSEIIDKEEIEAKIEDLFKEIFSSYILNGDIQINLSGSAGVALFPQDAHNCSDLLKVADTAMYKAKAAGKNRIMFSQE